MSRKKCLTSHLSNDAMCMFANTIKKFNIFCVSGQTNITQNIDTFTILKICYGIC